ncbi:MAG: tetratricopeptide repeat protein [Dehalococcoidales bacterium]|nr:tetratricopeptide repeat protein [Dehalococcoidales bacterium]
MKKFVFCAMVASILTIMIFGMSNCTSLSPNQAVEYYNQGVALKDKGKYDEAIASYNKAIEIDPNYTNAFISRGYAYLKTEQYEHAITDYTKAIRLDPKSAVAYNGRGAAYLYTKRYNSAALDFTRAFEIDPNFTQANKNLADVNNILSQAALHNTYGVNLAQTGNYDEAFVSFSKAIEIYPCHYPAYTNLGTIFTVTGQYESAITVFNTAILINHDYAPAYSGRGLAYIYTESYKEAINDLDKALEIEDPDDAADWNNKGVALEQLGELEGAATAYNTALGLDPDNEGIKSNVTSIASVIQSGGKPGGIKGRYLPPRRYWVGPKAEERTTETEFTPYTEPPPAIPWGGSGLVIGPKSLVGEWVDDSPRYGYIQSQQADTWNYNAVLNIVDQVSHQEPMQVEQPSTFTGTLRLTLASITGPITYNPNMMSYYHIGDTMEFPIHGTLLQSEVLLYVGNDIYRLDYDQFDFMGGSTEITDKSGLPWSVSLWLKRVQ